MLLRNRTFLYQDGGCAGQALWPARDISGTVAVRVKLDHSHVPFKGRGWEIWLDQLFSLVIIVEIWLPHVISGLNDN